MTKTNRTGHGKQIVAEELPILPKHLSSLPILPQHLSSPPDFSGVRVTRSLDLCVCFVDRCLSSCTFSFVHCVVCSSSIYGFWLPLWYLQTLLKNKKIPDCRKNSKIYKIDTPHTYIHNNKLPWLGTGFK